MVGDLIYTLHYILFIGKSISQAKSWNRSIRRKEGPPYPTFVACFLPDLLPSWLQHFGVTRDAYLATLETETRRRTRCRAVEQGSASVAMHHSFLQQQSDDSGRSAPMFRLHPPSPLAQDADEGLLWQNNLFVTTWKSRKTAQEDSHMVTVEDNERLQQEKVQSRKLEAERLQRSRDGLAKKLCQFIAAQNATAEQKR